MREYTDKTKATEPSGTLSSMSTAPGTRHPGGLLQLQRQYGNRYVQRLLALARKGEGEAEVDPTVESAITRSRGGGQALDSGLRLQMEQAFGSSFEGVRVHTGAEADSLNQSLSAVAFTTGQDIFFRESAYSPHTSEGKELLAHELTHVVQQGGGAVQGKLVLGAPGDRYEQEADTVARQVVTSLKDSDASSLKRQCACGGSTASGGECQECRSEHEAVIGQMRELNLQRQDNGDSNDDSTDGGAADGDVTDGGSTSDAASMWDISVI